jgi:hypothetical protein
MHAERDGAGACDFDLPVLVDYRPDLQLALFSPLRGSALSDLLHESSAGNGAGRVMDTDVALVLGARALAALHRSRITAGAVRTLDDDLTVVGRHVATLHADAPALAAHLTRALDAVRGPETAGAGPIGDPTLAHGRCHPARLLLGSGRPCVVDLEAVCLAEPARDLGHFLAGLPGAGGTSVAGSVAGSVARRFVEAYVDAAPVGGAFRERAARYQRCRTVLHAVQAWRAFDVPLLRELLAVIDADAYDEVPR